jgi:hypothetical protein
MLTVVLFKKMAFYIEGRSWSSSKNFCPEPEPEPHPNNAAQQRWFEESRIL